MFREGTRAYDFAAAQRIAVGVASGQSAAVNADEVLLHATTACFFSVGSNPTASNGAGSIPLEAGEKMHLRIKAGSLIAVIRNSADGHLFIAPCALYAS